MDNSVLVILRYEIQRKIEGENITRVLLTMWDNFCKSTAIQQNGRAI